MSSQPKPVAIRGNLRTPKNRGTERRPSYGGVPQRYKASDGSTHDFWLRGWHSSMDAYRAAYRTACEEIEARVARGLAEGVGDASKVTIKEYATRHWLKLNPRPKERTNRKYAGAPQEHEDGYEVRLTGDIKAVWEKWGDLTFAEVDYFAVRVWLADQPIRIGEAGRAMWRDATTDLRLECANPFANTNRRRSKGRAGENITVLTSAEVALLCQCAVDAWPSAVGLSVRGVLRFLADTGTRPGEAFALEHEWLHPAAERADIFPWVRDLKTGEVLGKTVAASRRIYVPTRTFETIATVPRLHDHVVFTAPRGGPFTPSIWDRYWSRTRALFMERLPADHHLHKRIERCVAAGIDPAHAPEGQGNFVTYELRHHFATRMLDYGNARGLDLARQVATQLGHKNGDPALVYAVYGHPDQDLALNMLAEVEREATESAEHGKVASLDEARRGRAS